MGEEGVAPDQKKTARLNAYLVFLDESGLMLAPLLRRTWAPRGQTPVFHESGRYRQKISAIAALTISPVRRRVGLYFALHSNENIRSRHVIVFLRDLANHVRRPILLIWDRLNVHRSKAVWEFFVKRSEFYVSYLPPYAPELNPVEGLWAHLKGNPLANYSPEDVFELEHEARRHARAIGENPVLLRSFLRGTPLFSGPR